MQSVERKVVRHHPAVPVQNAHGRADQGVPDPQQVHAAQETGAAAGGVVQQNGPSALQVCALDLLLRAVVLGRRAQERGGQTSVQGHRRDQRGTGHRRTGQGLSVGGQ